MEVECPDGSSTSIVSFDSGYVFGRKHLGAAADDSISREQFRLSLVQGVADVAQLHVLGRNGNARLPLINCCGIVPSCIVVQYRQTDTNHRYGGGDAAGSWCSFRHAF